MVGGGAEAGGGSSLGATFLGGPPTVFFTPTGAEEIAYAQASQASFSGPAILSTNCRAYSAKAAASAANSARRLNHATLSSSLALSSSDMSMSCSVPTYCHSRMFCKQK